MYRQAELISRSYQREQVRLHRQPQGYGGKGRKWAQTVIWLRRHLQADSVLDYGCGQGSLAKSLRQVGVTCREYDPAIPGKDALPGFADLVVCTDVLEHIEPDKLDAVLDHLKGLARKALILVVNLRLANKTLSDGRNAHLIIETAEWWQARVEAAGLAELEVPDDMPTAQALQLHPEKRQKCWVSVRRP